MSQMIIITNAGRAALVNATNTGTNPITIVSMGITSTAFIPSAETTALPSELKRISALSGGATAPDTLHLTVADEGSDAYAMRGYGFYLADGTLFAVHGQADPIVNKTASSMLLLALDVKFADINAEDLEFGDTNFMLPIATTTVYGQVKLATQAQANLGSEASAVLTPATARAALLGWLLAQDGSGSGVDADMLDGQHASAFLQASLFTGAQILSRLLTVDGAGSGVDADLLDGQQGAWYADIPARLGFNPLNSAAYTAADVFAKVLGLDGAGSGLDADLLDGQHGSFYTDIAARLGFTPANKAGDTFAGPIRRDANFGLDLGSGQPVINLDANDFLFYNRAANLLTLALGNIHHTIWHAGNDGAGSGLDADLLDGQHGAWFADIPARLGFTPVQQGTGVGQGSNAIKIGWSGSRLKATVDTADQGNFVMDANIPTVLGESGWIAFPNGLMIQFGWQASLTNRAANTITFPIAFPNTALRMYASLGSSLVLTANNIGVGATAISKTQGQIALATASPGTTGVHWLAIGC